MTIVMLFVFISCSFVLMGCSFQRFCLDEKILLLVTIRLLLSVIGARNTMSEKFASRFMRVPKVL